MSGSSPWSIKGVSREDREIAKQEARKSGEPIGVWLSRRIRDAADDRDRPAEPGSHAAGPHAAGPHPTGPHPAGPSGAPSPTGPSSASYPADGDRRQVVRGMGRRATDHPDFNFGPGNWRQARETILAREDARFSEGIAALRDRIRSVETRVESRGDSTAELEERLRGLGNRIADLTHRLDALERGPGDDRVERKVDRLEDELADLDRFARRLPSDTSDTIDGLERRIEQLLDRMRVVEEFVLPSQRKRGLFARMFGRKSR